MAHHRKHHKNIGGGAWYTGKGSNVEKEAEEKNKGGPVAKKKRGGGIAKRAYGGRSVGKHDGFLAGGRLDKRARGGGIAKLATGGGADRNPFSSAGSSGDRGKRTEAHGAHLVSAHASGGSVKKK